MFRIMDSALQDAGDLNLTVEKIVWRSPWYEIYRQLESGTVAYCL